MEKRRLRREETIQCAHTTIHQSSTAAFALILSMCATQTQTSSVVGTRRLRRDIATLDVNHTHAGLLMSTYPELRLGYEIFVSLIISYISHLLAVVTPGQ